MFTAGLALWWLDKIYLFFNYRLLHKCGGKFIRREGDNKVEEKEEEKMILDGELICECDENKNNNKCTFCDNKNNNNEIMDIDKYSLENLKIMNDALNIDLWGAVKEYLPISTASGLYIGISATGQEIEYKRFRYEYICKEMMKYNDKRYKKDFRTGIYHFCVYMYIFRILKLFRILSVFPIFGNYNISEF